MKVLAAALTGVLAGVFAEVHLWRRSKRGAVHRILAHAGLGQEVSEQVTRLFRDV